MADVFLSYASADRERVRPIADSLIERGWSVWWDRDITPGAAFEQTIDEQISAAACVVVCWSPHSVQSRWVRSEALDGLERNLLVPVVLESVRIPVAFNQCQVVDLSEGFTSESAEVASLVNAVGTMVGRPPAALADVLAPPESAKATVAVLPPRGDLSQPYDRMLIEDIVSCVSATIGRLPGYFVLSPATTLQYVGQSIDGAQTGRDLRVRYVVDGSYRHVGENIRITTRLTDTGSGEILWQDAFDRHREESLELAQEISLTIAAHLEPQLSLAELRRHDRARPRELETWEIIRRADALCRVRGWHPDVLAEAVELLDKAIEREPEMALPEAMKSVLLGVGNRLALWLDPSDARRAAVASAERALALDDTDSQVLGYVGCALADFHQTERAMVILDRALEFDATNAQAWAARALALSDLRKYDAAIADGLTSLRLSPKDNRLAGWLLGHAAILLKAGDLEEAGKYADLSRRRDPRHFGAWLLLGLIRFLRGDTDAAREPIAESLRLRPDLTFAHLERFLGAQAAGALRQAGLVPPGAD